MNTMLNCENENYSCLVEDTTAVFEFKKALFTIATDLEKKQRFFSLLHHIEESKDVQAILMLNAPGAVEQSEYERFLQQIYETGNTGQIGLGSEADVLISREEYAINQLLRVIGQSSKVTAIGLQGRIVPPFFGIALAFDFRFASAGTNFLFSPTGIDMPPSGGLCFFLPFYVGSNKATELIISNNCLQVDEALAMGLVNSVVPTDDFSERCQRKLDALIGLPTSVLSATKKLLSKHRREEFELYMEEEFKVMHNAWCERVRQIAR